MKNERRWVVGGMMVVAGVGVLCFAHFVPDHALPEHVTRAADIAAAVMSFIGADLVGTAIVKKRRG